MSWFYRQFIRPALFTQDPEQAHRRVMRSLAWASRRPLACDALELFFGAAQAPIDLFGLHFPNPIGLAAGMDKDAVAVPVWQAIGFGFTELGAVTWHPQPGNPQPRLFRAVSDGAIINRMGFNNAGATAVARTLQEWRQSGLWPQHPVGMNLGKSKVTPLEKAPEDYANSYRVLRPYLDFFVVNVSSPNTPGLRQLQDSAALDQILAAIQECERSEQSKVQSPKSTVHSPESTVHSRRPATSSDHETPESSGSPIVPHPSSLTAPPLLVKVAPDLSFDALDRLLELADRRQIAGIVASNTSITRPQTSEAALQRIYAEAGGLSGRPLRALSTEIIRHLFRQSRGALPIVGVGGVFDAADAWEKITAGASLVQLYTGLIYEGPSIASSIVNGLLERLETAGLRELRQAVGISAT